jgi:hypothetical protein
VFTLVVLLIGLGIGLAPPQPWAAVPEAEAASQRVWRCFSPGTGAIFVHNPTARNATVRLVRYARNGTASQDLSPASDFTVGPNEEEEAFVPVSGGVIDVRSDAAIIVDASTIYLAGDTSEQQRQAACYKLGK